MTKCLRVLAGSLFVAVLSCGLHAPCWAQGPAWSAPLELTSGFWSSGASPTPYAFALHTGVLKFIETGRHVLGPAAALSYDGANWTGLVGARGATRVLGFRDAGLFLVGEMLVGESRAPGSAALEVDIPISAALYPRFGFWLTHDFDA